VAVFGRASSNVWSHPGEGLGRRTSADGLKDHPRQNGTYDPPGAGAGEKTAALPLVVLSVRDGHVSLLGPPHVRPPVRCLIGWSTPLVTVSRVFGLVSLDSVFYVTNNGHRYKRKAT
jgi:hypothetical protein